MQNVPKIVLKRLQWPAAESHPDADLLAAFAEHSLAGRERDHVLQHLAHCGDCREVVALALPATEEVVVAHRSSDIRIGWLSWPVLRWGVVAAGILAVTSAGVLQYRQRRQEKTLVATSLAPREQLPAAQSPAPSLQASVSPTIAPQTEMGQQTAVREKKASSARSALAAGKPVSNANGSVQQPRPMYGIGPAEAPAGSGGAFRSGSGAGRSVTAGRVSTQRGAEPAESSSDQSEAVGKAKQAVAQSSPAGMAPAPSLRSDPSLMKNTGAPRWTISASGALQRSLDGGRTWLDVEMTVDNSTSADLRRPAKTGMKSQVAVEVGGSEAKLETQSDPRTQAKSKANYDAPSSMKSAVPAPASASAATTIFRALSVSADAAEVWAGGSGAALYRTMDGGNRWARVVPSDSGAVLTGDIIGIQFSDTQNGTVRTSTAEVWTTLDAGQTWHKQQ